MSVSASDLPSEFIHILFFNKMVNAMMMIIDNNQNADDTLHFSVLSNIMMDF